MLLYEHKLAMFVYKLIFILLPHLIATLNNYACSLANINWSASAECFFLTMLIHIWWNDTDGWLQGRSGDLISHLLSADVCIGFVVE